MANTWSSAGDGPNSTPVDAAADLAMLERAKASVDLEQALDFGPVWYAPLLATMAGALTLFSQGSAGDWAFVYLAVGIITGSIVTVHDFRRRKVRQRPSLRSAAATVPIVLSALAVVVAWGTAVSTLGYERFVPGYAIVGWLLTTGLLLALRWTLKAISAGKDPIT